MTTADRNYLIKYLTVDSNHGLQEHGHGGLLWEHGEELLLAQWRPEVRRGGRRARARRAYMSSPRVLSCRRQHKSEAAKKVRTSSRYGSAGLVKYHVFSSCSPRFWGNRPSPLPAARRCCHESACRRAKGSTACKSGKGQHRLPRQHQCHEVHRGQEVKQHEQGLHQGHLWQVQVKVGGLHRGPKNGPPTPMYDVCKKNFVSADSLSSESLSLHIFTPKHSKKKFCYNFLKKVQK